MAAAPESRLDWFQNPTVNKGLGAGLATIALAGVGAGIGIVLDPLFIAAARTSTTSRLFVVSGGLAGVDAGFITAGAIGYD